MILVKTLMSIFGRQHLKQLTTHRTSIAKATIQTNHSTPPLSFPPSLHPSPPPLGFVIMLN